MLIETTNIMDNDFFIDGCYLSSIKLFNYKKRSKHAISTDHIIRKINQEQDELLFKKIKTSQFSNLTNSIRLQSTSNLSHFSILKMFCNGNYTIFRQIDPKDLYNLKNEYNFLMSEPFLSMKTVGTFLRNNLNQNNEDSSYFNTYEICSKDDKYLFCLVDGNYNAYLNVEMISILLEKNIISEDNLYDVLLSISKSYKKLQNLIENKKDELMCVSKISIPMLNLFENYKKTGNDDAWKNFINEVKTKLSIFFDVQKNRNNDDPILKNIHTINNNIQYQNVLKRVWEQSNKKDSEILRKSVSVSMELFLALNGCGYVTKISNTGTTSWVKDIKIYVTHAFKENKLYELTNEAKNKYYLKDIVINSSFICKSLGVPCSIFGTNSHKHPNVSDANQICIGPEMNDIWCKLSSSLDTTKHQFINFITSVEKILSVANLDSAYTQISPNYLILCDNSIKDDGQKIEKNTKYVRKLINE